jgi:hypothetical protein
MQMETILAINEIHDTGFDIVTDKQTIQCRIDNGQSCCENWGYFMTNDDVNEFIGAKLLDVAIVDKLLNEKKLDMLCEADVEGGVMFVNFVTSQGVLQFTAYNSHNGYYGHEASVKSIQLNHNEVL